MTAIKQIEDALKKAYHLGQRYWQQADSDYKSDHRKSDATAANFHLLVNDTEAAMREVLAHIAAQDAEIARLREMLAGDNGALSRMERARGWLTDDNPRSVCNWGVLDTEDMRDALATTTPKG